MENTHNSFTEQRCYRENLKLGLFLVIFNRKGIGYNKLLEAGVLYTFSCRVSQNWMANGCINTHSTRLIQCLSAFAEGTGCVDNIINEDAASVLYRTDNVHNLGYPWFRTALFNNGNRCAQTVSQFSGTVRFSSFMDLMYLARIEVDMR